MCLGIGECCGCFVDGGLIWCGVEVEEDLVGFYVVVVFYCDCDDGFVDIGVD